MTVISKRFAICLLSDAARCSLQSVAGFQNSCESSKRCCSKPKKCFRSCHYLFQRTPSWISPSSCSRSVSTQCQPHTTMLTHSGSARPGQTCGPPCGTARPYLRCHLVPREIEDMPLPYLLRCQTAYGRFNHQHLALYIMLSVVSITSLVMRQHKFVDLVQLHLQF